MAKKTVIVEEESSAPQPKPAASGPSWLVTIGMGILFGVILSLVFIALQFAGTIFAPLMCITGAFSCCVLIWLLPLITGALSGFIAKSGLHGAVGGAFGGLVGGLITTGSAFVLPVIANTVGGVMNNDVANGIVGGLGIGAFLGILSLVVYPLCFMLFGAIGGFVAGTLFKRK
jgi:hypothetical protein